LPVTDGIAFEGNANFKMIKTTAYHVSEELTFRSGANAIKKITPSLGIPFLGV